jgi:hypothetical protein
MENILEKVAAQRAERHYTNYEKRNAQAEREAQEIARSNQGSRSIKGLGQLKYEIPGNVAKEWMHQEHKDILRDPDFIKYQQQKNPELFAKQDRRRNTVGYGD